eukprot:CAMPEP_0185909460 /NCGR_PEP_ID=MMETSP0196C-20130402/12965_1 /TAXON_ID=2932 /ORGANISM="Alexandrium fundyense, Strain CCMP1719" /LENGTH=32 /DNA_ID= /DNA_START= /DNA_END= /DNA_ORIENTATION=
MKPPCGVIVEDGLIPLQSVLHAVAVHPPVAVD